MIAGLDGTPLTLTSGGLRRYTEELLNALRSEFPADKFFAVSDQLTPPANFFERRWWSLGLPRALARLECDLFHGTDFAVPYLPFRPAVMSVHDLSPWLDPRWHSGALRVRRRAPVLLRTGLATMVITGTQAVKRQIVERFRVAPDRVAVVPDAPAAHLKPVFDTKPLRPPYFLFAGTVEPRKNVPVLVDAWRAVRPVHEVDLIIAGRRRADGPEFPPTPGLIVCGEVTDMELARLYSDAVALVYPSLYEGFGLPVIEAMQCGAPVIASRDPALVEVAGGAALHASDADLSLAMTQMFEQPALRQHYREAGFRRARDFSWKQTARQTREVYAEAIERFRFRR